MNRQDGISRRGPGDSAEFGPLMGAVGAVCAAGCVAAIWPAAEAVIAAGLLGVPLAAGAVWAVGREARIRRRCADVPGIGRRVGPGDGSRALPAPTSTSTSEFPRAAAPAGRAIQTRTTPTRTTQTTGATS